ncbi:uncharacterized protein LOC113302475 [Papaver somniferum]|uniref:uncharacterized protein LOC113302475 n=1 Tax=Papaver somniferum TaxID=3469 RepID=UPI000E6F619A|nr:uncharacterized protein LOC113302475 [Papaver somniferum]
MVTSFFTTGFILREINATFISLIPKIEFPQSASDYRPINLSNIVYKMISKTLANRLKVLLPKIISPFQSAFVPGRQISDNVLIAHELIHTMRAQRGNEFLMGIKVDMSKAFDRVEWNFLLYVMRNFGFSEEWCNLINQCINTVSSLVLVNGVPGYQFVPSRGLRQGDPLSPYLFIVCMEVLSRAISNVEESNLIHGIKIAFNAPPISHLLFADDLLVFSSANLLEGENILKLFTDFSNASGQLINFENSGIFFNTNSYQDTIDTVNNILGVRRIALNDKYLGSPLFTHISKGAGCGEGQDQQDPKIFFWGKDVTITRGVYLKGWTNICVLKDMGGMGFLNLKIFNNAMLAKVTWRLVNFPDFMLAQVMKHKYYSDHSLLNSEIRCPATASWGWKNIYKEMSKIRNNSVWVVGNGKMIRIWEDLWCGEVEGTLQPLDQQSMCFTFVAELMDCDGEQGNWNMSKLQLCFQTDVVEIVHFLEWVNNWFTRDDTKERRILKWPETMDTIMWGIWKTRCDLVFRKDKPNVARTKGYLMSEVYPCSRTWQRGARRPGGFTDDQVGTRFEHSDGPNRGDDLKVLEATRKEVNKFAKAPTRLQEGYNLNFRLCMKGIKTLTMIPTFENSVARNLAVVSLSEGLFSIWDDISFLNFMNHSQGMQDHYQVSM